MDEIPLPPRGLDAAGKKLWRVYAGDRANPEDTHWVFNTSELDTLRRACLLEDVAERLRAELKDSTLTVRGSQGQPTANALIGELRQTQLAVHRLLLSLGVPGLEDVENDDKSLKTGRFSSETGQKAAHSRWDNG